MRPSAKPVVMTCNKEKVNTEDAHPFKSREPCIQASLWAVISRVAYYAATVVWICWNLSPLQVVRATFGACAEPFANHM